MCFQYGPHRKWDGGSSDVQGSRLQLEGFYHSSVTVCASDPQALSAPARETVGPNAQSG